MSGEQRVRTEDADAKRYQSLKDKKGNDKRADWSGSPEEVVKDFGCACCSVMAMLQQTQYAQREIHRNTSRDKIAATQLPRTESRN